MTRLLRDLRSSSAGLSEREAARRLQVVGRNELRSAGGRRWPRELAKQLVHPLALLLWAAAVLAWIAGTRELALAIVAVVLLNAALAFFQEKQAERAVAALADYLPPTARVTRGGRTRPVPVAELVPGDVVLLDEGDRVPADARLLRGALEIDASPLTGESMPVERSADADDDADRRLDSPVLVFSGTGCVGGSAVAVVHATGAHTEIGRIAALSGRVSEGESPLERQIKRVAWLIAAVAACAGAAFLPLGLLAGLSWSQAFIFAIGLLVANVPEGLLPTITLALAAGVRTMARRGALVKRLSAVETLGSTTVICTDKTGTLTQNTMRAVEVRTGTGADGSTDTDLAEAAARCTTADLEQRTGDPTELALLELATAMGVPSGAGARDTDRRVLYRFDPRLKRMATVDSVTGALRIHVKGAPEEVLPRCVTVRDPGIGEATCDQARRDTLDRVIDETTGRGLRVLAVARKDWPGPYPPSADAAGRNQAESRLCLLGLIGLLDAPRPEVPAAVQACHSAGMVVHVVTGDNGRTAAEIAKRVGIRADVVMDGPTLDALPEDKLDELLLSGNEVIFARSSPEAKLRIADALRHHGAVVAMTGDGVNDAPALRRADIGVAMGISGTEVAREAAEVILTDDNFATIVAGIEEGRRVYDNVRKFVLYIFAHTVPEVAPFLLFALAGGLVPLPLTVLQILAIDLGTETLPALALGREPAEPGIMARPPLRRSTRVISGRMLLRAWGVLGLVSTVLVLGTFFAVLWHTGWTPGADTSPGSALHTSYLQATTATFAAIVACQIGTAFAARTEQSSLRAVGLTTNRLLLAGIVFEVAFAAAVVYLPPLQAVFGTAALPLWVLLLMLPFPIVVWGTDELFRWSLRRQARI